MQALVIGSGPSGISCAVGLLQSGNSVTLVDAGSDNSRSLEKVRTRFAQLPFKAALKEVITGESISTIESVNHPTKNLLGIKMREGNTLNSIEQQALGVRTSHEIGGLSNVWGATLLPLNMSEIWKNLIFESPVEELLSKLEIPRTHEIPSTPFNGEFHQMPLAIFTSGTKKCLNTGICIAGCPQDAIYSSIHTLEKLKKHKNFKLVTDCKIEKLIYDGRNIFSAQGKIQGDQKINISADKIYLACGPIGSFEILARSGLVEPNAIMKDSAMTIIPTIEISRKKRNSLVGSNLTDKFISMENKETSPIFFQVYRPNILFASKIKPVARRIIANKDYPKFLFNFLGVITAYSDSTDSTRIHLRYNSFTADSDNLSLESQGSSIQVKIGIKKIFKFIRIGVIPLFFLAKTTSPGSGIHYGGNLPMSQVPRENTTTEYGALWDFPQISVVDSSILPEIPAGPITLTLIANAYRIGVNS